MENHHFFVGDTSSNGGFPIAMLVYRECNHFVHLTDSPPKLRFAGGVVEILPMMVMKIGDESHGKDPQKKITQKKQSKNK